MIFRAYFQAIRERYNWSAASFSEAASLQVGMFKLAFCNSFQVELEKILDRR